MDDLRSTIEAAASSTENADAPSSSPVVSDSAPATPATTHESAATPVESQSASPVPDAAASQESASDKPTIEEVAGDAGKAVGDDTETQQQKEARSRVDRAPQSWKGEAKKLWEQLPLQVRQEVARRERDVMQTMQTAAGDRQKVQEMVQVLQPHANRINALYGGNPMAAVNNLLQAEAMLTAAPANERARFVAQMIKQYQVDVEMLDSYLANQPLPEKAAQATYVEQLLEQKLAPFQQFIQTQRQREQQELQRTEQKVVGHVEQMASDTTNYPYFNDVRADMADIIEISAKRGIALSLDEAYHRAIRMNDDVYQASSVRESSQSATQQALDAHRAAQAAKGASVSVSGSPTGSSRGVSNPSDLRGTIASMFDGGRL